VKKPSETKPLTTECFPPIPFPDALQISKPPVQNSHLIETFKKTTITIPLEDAIKFFPFSKDVKELCMPIRKKKRVNYARPIVLFLWIRP